MKTYYKITVYKTIDFDVLKDYSHTSISGGVATHSFDKIGEFKEETLTDVIKTITINYGTPYIFDNRLELQKSESETLSFYLERVRILDLDHDRLKKAFSFLEDVG